MAIYFQGAGEHWLLFFRDLWNKLIVSGIQGALQRVFKKFSP